MFRQTNKIDLVIIEFGKNNQPLVVEIIAKIIIGIPDNAVRDIAVMYLLLIYKSMKTIPINIRSSYLTLANNIPNKKKIIYSD